MTSIYRRSRTVSDTIWRRIYKLLVAASTAAGLTSCVPRAAAAQLGDTARYRPDSASRLELEARIDELDQRVRVLARLRELAADSAAVAAKTQVVATAGSEGFALLSADGAFQLRLRGYIQADGRTYASAAQTPPSTVLLRRVRPVLEGTLYGRYGFRFMPDFGNGQTVLYDAYAEASLWPALTVRAGKFKPPVGLERLQSATDIRFVERGLPTNLVTNRDLGLQLAGEVAGGRLAYQAGVFNGVPDLALGDGDATSSKDVIGRFFVQPFQRGPSPSDIDLGLGVAASAGREQGTPAAPALASYRTPGQAAMFRYRSDATSANSTVADGARSRLAPQGYLYAGPIGLLAEYVRSAQRVRRDTASARLGHAAWQLSGSWAVTGERETFRGLRPRTEFDPQARTWGALELVARYGALTLDDAAFPVYANPAVAARSARAWAIGANWRLARTVTLGADYERTTFTGGAPSGNRAPETFIVTRFQTAF